MTYDEAMEGHSVSPGYALAELSSHGILAQMQDGRLMALDESTHRDWPNRLLCEWVELPLDSKAILEWLGY